MGDFGAVHVHMGLQKTMMRSVSHISVASGNRALSINDLTAEESCLPETRITHSSLPHVGFSARNEDWTSVQHSIISIFNKRKLSTYEMRSLVSNVRAVIKSDIGPFISEYYQKQLLKKGCRSLRESITKDVDAGADVLASLGETWNYFYKDILPTLQFALHPVQTKDLSVRQATLMGFRDNLLLKLDIKQILQQVSVNASAAIKQMLLVLQSVCECMPPSDQFLQLEQLVALVIEPYLGFGSLYMGKKGALIKAELKQPSAAARRPEDDIIPMPSHTRPVTLHLGQITASYKYFRQASIPNPLNTVNEVGQDLRRHSISVT